MPAGGLEILEFPEADVPRALRVRVLALQDRTWPPEAPSPGTEPGPVHDPALHPRSMLLVRDGRVVAALDVLTKDIVHEGESYTVSGLSTVVTDEAERGKGHGGRLVAAARERIRASGVDLGIFTCDLSLRAFYERAGWSVLPGTVLVGGTQEHPFPSDRFDKVTVAAFFSERARAATDRFVGARIGLYPGEIDRLW